MSDVSDIQHSVLGQYNTQLEQINSRIGDSWQGEGCKARKLEDTYALICNSVVVVLNRMEANNEVALDDVITISATLQRLIASHGPDLSERIRTSVANCLTRAQTLIQEKTNPQVNPVQEQPLAPKIEPQVKVEGQIIKPQEIEAKVVKDLPNEPKPIEQNWDKHTKPASLGVVIEEFKIKAEKDDPASLDEAKMDLEIICRDLLTAKGKIETKDVGVILGILNSVNGPIKNDPLFESLGNAICAAKEMDDGFSKVTLTSDMFTATRLERMLDEIKNTDERNAILEEYNSLPVADIAFMQSNVRDYTLNSKNAYLATAALRDLAQIITDAKGKLSTEDANQLFKLLQDLVSGKFYADDPEYNAYLQQLFTAVKGAKSCGSFQILQFEPFEKFLQAEMAKKAPAPKEQKPVVDNGPDEDLVQHLNASLPQLEADVPDVNFASMKLLDRLEIAKEAKSGNIQECGALLQQLLQAEGTARFGILLNMVATLSDSARDRLGINSGTELDTIELKKQIYAQMNLQIDMLLTKTANKNEKTALINQLKGIADNYSVNSGLVGILSKCMQEIIAEKESAIARLTEAEPQQEIAEIGGFDIDLNIPEPSNWDKFVRWLENLWNSIFGSGEVISLTDEEIRRRIKGFANTYGSRLMEIKDNAIEVNAKVRTVFEQRLLKTFAQPGCSIPAAEHGERARQYVDLLLNSIKTEEDKFYGKFAGVSADDMPSDSLIKQIYCGNIVNVAQIPEASMAELSNMTSELKISAKRRALLRISDLCHNYSKEEIAHNPLLRGQMQMIINEEVASALGDDWAIRMGHIIDTPAKIEVVNEKAQYIISQFSQGVRDPQKFVSVVLDMNSMIHGCENGKVSMDLNKDLPDAAVIQAKKEEMKAVFFDVFRSMNLMQFKKMIEGWAIKTGEMESGLGGILKDGTAILSRIVYLQNQRTVGFMKDFGQFVNEYLQTEEGRKLYDEDLARMSTIGDQSDIPSFKKEISMTDLMARVGLNLAYLGDIQNQMVTQYNSKDIALVMPTVNVTLNHVIKEAQSRVDRILDRMARYENQQDVNFAQMFDKIKAEVEALNEAMNANNLTAAERTKFDKMINIMINRAIKRGQENRLLDRLMERISMPEFKLAYTENINPHGGDRVDVTIDYFIGHIKDLHSVRH